MKRIPASPIEEILMVRLRRATIALNMRRTDFVDTNLPAMRAQINELTDALAACAKLRAGKSGKASLSYLPALPRKSATSS